MYYITNMRKVLSILVCFLFTVLVVGCPAVVSRLTRVTIPYTTEPIKVPGMASALPEIVQRWELGDIPFPAVIGLDGKQTLSTQVAKASKLTSVALNSIEIVQLKKLELRLIDSDPTGSDIGFIQDIHIFINAEDTKEQQFDKELFAWVEEMPKDSKTIIMETSNDNLAEYFKQDTFTLQVMAKPQEIPLKAKEYTFEIEFEVFVDVNLFGL